MLEVAGKVLLEITCVMTGHAVLWVLTLGRWKLPKGRDDVAALVGILFWVMVGVVVWLVFIR